MGKNKNSAKKTDTVVVGQVDAEHVVAAPKPETPKQQKKAQQHKVDQKSVPIEVQKAAKPETPKQQKKAQQHKADQNSAPIGDQKAAKPETTKPQKKAQQHKVESEKSVENQKAETQKPETTKPQKKTQQKVEQKSVPIKDEKEVTPVPKNNKRKHPEAAGTAAPKVETTKQQKKAQQQKVEQKSVPTEDQKAETPVKKNNKRKQPETAGTAEQEEGGKENKVAKFDHSPVAFLHGVPATAKDSDIRASFPEGIEKIQRVNDETTGTFTGAVILHYKTHEQVQLALQKRPRQLLDTRVQVRVLRAFPDNCKSLFVGGFDQSVTTLEALKKHLASFDIKPSRIDGDPATGHCYLYFDTVEQARKAHYSDFRTKGLHGRGPKLDVHVPNQKKAKKLNSQE